MSMLFFGYPWPSYALINATRVATPVGTPCGHCTLHIEDGDQGHLMNGVTLAKDGTLQHEWVPFHKECYVRMGVGSVEHLGRRCGCATGHFTTAAEALGIVGASTKMSEALAARIDALATWDWVMRHGTRTPLDDAELDDAELDAGAGDDVVR